MLIALVVHFCDMISDWDLAEYHWFDAWSRIDTGKSLLERLIEGEFVPIGFRREWN